MQIFPAFLKKIFSSYKFVYCIIIQECCIEHLSEDNISGQYTSCRRISHPSSMLICCIVFVTVGQALSCRKIIRKSSFHSINKNVSQIIFLSQSLLITILNVNLTLYIQLKTHHLQKAMVRTKQPSNKLYFGKARN